MQNTLCFLTVRWTALKVLKHSWSRYLHSNAYIPINTDNRDTLRHWRLGSIASSVALDTSSSWAHLAATWPTKSSHCCRCHLLCPTTKFALSKEKFSSLSNFALRAAVYKRTRQKRKNLKMLLWQFQTQFISKVQRKLSRYCRQFHFDWRCTCVKKSFILTKFSNSLCLANKNTW